MKLAFSLLLILMLTACGGTRIAAPVSSYDYESQESSSPPNVYIVRKGDTLYSISWRFGMDYKTVAQINNINSPYTIYAGQKLKFTAPKTSKTARSSTRPQTANKSTSNKSETKKSSSSQTKNKTKETFVGSRNLSWHWPTNGRVVSTYSTSSPGRKGIDIAGSAGQSVVSAASGKVVYSGNGLPRYGNLLIIKHNDVYLSAYAHNQKLLVKEGDIVKSGQKIALLGRSGTQSNKLHFEIRRNGKPVDPLRFLPKR